MISNTTNPSTAKKQLLGGKYSSRHRCRDWLVVVSWAVGVGPLAGQGVPDHDDRARGVVDAVLASRTEQRFHESAMSAAAHNQQVCAG